VSLSLYVDNHPRCLLEPLGKSYWPYRYVTDPDAAEVLDIFKRVVDSGRHLSIMAHFSHHVELESPIVREAIRRIRLTGANIRCQAPLVKHVNDSPDVWEKVTAVSSNPVFA